MVIRPEDLKVVPEQEGMLTGVVQSVIFKGVHYEMMIKSSEFLWMVHSTLMEEVGSTVGLTLRPNDIHIMKKVRQD